MKKGKNVPFTKNKNGRIDSWFLILINHMFVGRAWHKGCFKCTLCHRALDSRIACDGPDNDVYCNGKLKKKSKNWGHIYKTSYSKLLKFL